MNPVNAVNGQVNRGQAPVGFMPGRQMNLVKIEPVEDARWASLVAGTNSSVFHSPSWLRVLHDTYGLSIHAYLLINEFGHPVAGIPYSCIEDLKGKRLISLPFSDFCDPLAVEPSHWEQLLDNLLEEGAPVFFRCVHSLLPLDDPRLSCYNQAKWHGLDLHPEVPALWQGLHSSARQAIRKAQQNGIEVCVAQTKEELRAFYEMHLEVRKHKYHLLAQPYSFFERIWENFVDRGDGALLLARKHNEIVGGTFFLRWQDKLFYKFNASALGNLADRPNDLLIWEGIQLAKAWGCVYLDFGLSDWDQEGLIRYKRKFADSERTISFVRSVATPALTDQEQQIRALLPQLTALLTDAAVPNHVTEKAGELLYRLFV